ncbi:MAG: hypothetical protein ACR2N8_02975 [Parvibaculales bacterium]
MTEIATGLYNDTKILIRDPRLPEEEFNLFYSRVQNNLELEKLPILSKEVVIDDENFTNGGSIRELGLVWLRYVYSNTSTRREISQYNEQRLYQGITYKTTGVNLTFYNGQVALVDGIDYLLTGYGLYDEEKVVSYYRNLVLTAIELEIKKTRQANPADLVVPQSNYETYLRTAKRELANLSVKV